MERWYYEKMDQNNDIKHCPNNDYDGSITGHIIVDLPTWFDENPEIRKQLGWIKHIVPDKDEVDYNKQSQFLTTSTEVIDEYTVRDTYHVMDKSEEMMLLEEMFEHNHILQNSVFFI